MRGKIMQRKRRGAVGSGSRFHPESVPLGQSVSIFWMDPSSGKRLDLLARATVGQGGWVDLAAPIIVRAGQAFVAVLDSADVP